MILETLISIHALLAESDASRPAFDAIQCRFLSTLSLRRATSSADEFMRFNAIFLSTLSLRRATNYNSLQGKRF